MFSRRTFLSLVAGSIAAPEFASAQPSSQKVALYEHERQIAQPQA